MERAGGDRRRVAARDELAEKVLRLLTVRQACKRSVLPFDEHPGEHQHMHQKARLTQRKAQIHELLDSTRAGTLLQVERDGTDHRNSSATRGSKPRPPLRPLPPPRP